MRRLTARLSTVAGEVQRLLEAIPAQFEANAVAPASSKPLAGVSGVPLYVDVGCDHAGLPLTLLSRGVAATIIAVDINAAPCELARQNARKLELPLEVRQGAGLDPVAGRVDVVSICGVGSDTVVGILEAAKDRIGAAVVQPNDGAEVVRRWAMGAGWAVTRERGVWDRGRYFGVLVLGPGVWTGDEVEIAWGVAAQVDREALRRRLGAEVRRLAAWGRGLGVALQALERLSVPK